MTGAKHTYLLYSAGALMLLADLIFGHAGFSESYGLPKGSLYYTSVALSVFLFHLFIFLNFNKYCITFILLGFSINKLFDELFFDPQKLQLNELFFAISITIIGVLYYHSKTLTSIVRRIWKKLYKANTDDTDSDNSDRVKVDS